MDDTIKAVAFDVDGTILEFTIWPKLHALFNFSMEEDKRLHTLYHEGKLSYRDWMEEVYGGYLRKGPTRYKAEIEPLMRDFRLVPGAETVMAELQTRYPLALVSSGLMDYVRPVGDHLKIPDVYTFTHLIYGSDDAYTGLGYDREGDEILMKVSALAEWGAKIGVKPSEIAFVGDSVNDMGAFRYTGRGILKGESTEAMRNVAWRQIRALSELLDIL
jgi:HAD superfamily phosphoserine phosphatase-like hydrolase